MDLGSPTRPSDPGRSAIRPQSNGRKLTMEERIEAIKRRQKLQDAAAICDTDITQYTLIFEVVRKNEVDDLIKLEEVVSRVQEFLKQQKCLTGFPHGTQPSKNHTAQNVQLST